jgi:hypothetical protein
MTSRTESGQRVYDAMGDPSRTCTRCVSFNVCTVHRAMHRQLTFDYPGVIQEVLPFNVIDLAKICLYYRRANLGEDA